MPRTAHYLDPAHLLTSIPLALGGILWILTYILIIRRSFKDRAYGLPMFAICLNITWESLAVLSCNAPEGTLGLSGICPMPPATSPTLKFAETAGILVDVFWLGLDVILAWQLFRWGRQLERVPHMRRHWTRNLVGLIVIFFFLQLGFVTYYDDIFLIVNGWIINMVMSLGFLFLLWDREKWGLRGLSWPAAWTKMAANLFYAGGLTLVFYSGPGEHPFQPDESWTFMYVMFAATFLFDVLYITHLKRARDGGASPPRSAVPEPA